MGRIQIAKAAASERTSLFLDIEGNVWLAGKIGCGHFSPEIVAEENDGCATTPEQITLPEGVAITDIATGKDHIALTSNTGDVYLAGVGVFGNLGMGDGFYQDLAVPTRLATQHKIQKATIGYAHTLFLTDKGKVYATGSNSHGVLGIMQEDSHKNHFHPQLVIALSDKNVVDIVAGKGQTTFFLTDEGKVYACGSGMRHCLGYEMDGYGILPLLLTDLEDEFITQIESVYHYTTFLTRNGEVYACGASFPDPLVEKKQPYEPVKASKFCEEPIIQIAAGSYQVCYLTADGHVYMSDKKAGGEAAPKRMTSLPKQKKVSSIAAGEQHFIFIMEDGNVFTCGKGKHGALGLGKSVLDKDISLEKPEEIKIFTPGKPHTQQPRLRARKKKELFDDVGEEDKAILTAIHMGNLPLLKKYDPKGNKVKKIKDESGRNALQFSIQCVDGDNIEILDWLTSKPGGNISIHGTDGEMTPFLRAVQANKIDVMRWLAKRGANINAVIQPGLFNALHIAANVGSEQLIRWLLRHENANLDVNSETYGQETPFIIAVARGSLGVMKMLKSHGAKVLVTNSEGMNPLHVATWHFKHAEIVDWLASRRGGNIDINSRDNQQRTPFMMALLKPSTDKGLDQVALLKQLKQLGADTTLVDENGLNALHHAVMKSVDPSLMTWLTSDACGTPINRKTSDGSTPLVLAAARHEQALVQTLLVAGADATAVDEENNNALIAAIRYAPPMISVPYHGVVMSSTNANIVTWLLEEHSQRFDLKHKVEHGYTALHIAAANDGFDVVKQLVDLDPSLMHEKNDEDQTPLDVAEENEHQAIVDYFKSIRPTKKRRITQPPTENPSAMFSGRRSTTRAAKTKSGYASSPGPK
ncbi:MAG: hypothetical protein DHS20C10_11450 [marine bacterium B5-7]|nr:MAG: hypothetical protein DHS20C10_11450 [marine bacterium B5-7]